MTKIVRYLLVIIAIVMSMASCNMLSRDKEDVKSSEVIEEEYPTKDEITGKTNVHDSVYNKLTGQVEALKACLDSINTNFNSQAEQLKDCERAIARLRIIVIIAIVFAAIALLFVLYTNKHCVYEDQIYSFLKRFVINSDLVKRMIEEHIYDAVAKNMHKNKMKTQNSSVAFYSIPELKEIEKRISDLEEANKNNISYSRNNKVPVQPRTVKFGYAKTNSNNKFTEVMPSNQEGCVYKIRFINDNEGEFDLIELSMLQQTPNYKDVVEIVEGCSLSEAKNYDVISVGKCEKIESGKYVAWKVTEKLKIKTFK